MRIGAGCWNGLPPVNTGLEASTDGSAVSVAAGVDAAGTATAFVGAAPVDFPAALAALLRMAFGVWLRPAPAALPPVCFFAVAV